jgi:hypothetical protein
METNDEDEGIEQLIKNKEIGFSRANPQSEAGKRNEMSMFNCLRCEQSFRIKEHLVTHQKTHAFNCLTCDETFQSDDKLQDHVKKVHDELICHVQCDSGQCMRGETSGLQMESVHKCNFCGESFMSKNTLTTHKADVHRTYKPCRDPINCVYQAGCYFSHVPVPIGKVRCFQCGEEFATKNTMMIHRKIHGEVKACQKQISSQYNRGDSCWFDHEKPVFQHVKENLPPPIQKIPVMKPQMNIPNQILVDMLKVMDSELKKIKEVLNIN